MKIETVKKLLEEVATENDISGYIVEYTLDEALCNLDKGQISYQVIRGTPNNSTLIIFDLKKEGKFHCELIYQKVSNDWGEDLACDIDEIKRLDGHHYNIFKNHLQKKVQEYQNSLKEFCDENYERQYELTKVFRSE